MEDILPVVFLVALVGVIGFFVYRMFRFGGLKGAMFGAGVERTVGQVSGEKQGPVGVALKVHILRREPSEKLIGMELTAKSFASYKMTPITLSAAQAKQLVSLLERALSETSTI